MTAPKSNLRGAVCSLAAFGLFSLYDMTVKFLGGSYSPFQILFFAGLATFPLIMVQLMSDRSGQTLIPVLPKWTALRIGVTIVNGLLSAYAFSVLPLAQCYAVFFMMPLFICLLAVPMLAEPIDLPRGLAVLAGFAGVVIVLRPDQMALHPGHFAAITAAALGAVNYVVLRKTGGVERPAVLMLYPMVAQLVVVTIVLPFVYQPMPMAHLGLTGLMAVEMFAGSLLIIAAYRHAPAVVAAPMQYSQIIWATAFGTLFFNEHMAAPTGLGIAVIIASGLFIVLRSGAPDKSTPKAVTAKT